MPSHSRTVIDFPTSTYHDRGGEIYQLTSCVRSDGGAYVAGPAAPVGHPSVVALQRWLLPQPGWMVGCTLLQDPDAQPLPDWHVDLVAIEVTPDQWRVTDHFIDVTVFEGERYEVLDLDEFVDALAAGSLPVETGLDTLRSLHQLCTGLTDAEFSVNTLLERHAPTLPGFRPWDVVSPGPDDAPLSRH